MEQYMDHITIHSGDALKVLSKMPAESVHCVVTSPPYWGLRASTHFSNDRARTILLDPTKWSSSQEGLSHHFAMSKQLEIHFGFFSPTIAQQLRKQGFRYTTEKVKIFQRNSTMIGQLSLADLVTDAEKKRMRDRLYNRIKRHVLQMNRPKKPKPSIDQ